MIAERLLKNLPQKLKKAQIIFKKYRADNAWGRTAVKYPVCNYEPYTPIPRNGVMHGTSLGIKGVVSYEPAIQLNTTHSCMENLKKRLQDGEIETSIPKLLNIRCEGGEGDDEIYKVRKAFMSGKSLYRD